MSRLTLDDVRHALPELDELRPIFDYLVGRSEPDGARTWAGSAQLDTLGSRLLPDMSLAEELTAVAAREAETLGAIYSAAGRALTALADDDRPSAVRAFLEAAELEEERDRPARAAAYADAAHRAAQQHSDRRLASLALRRSARALRALGSLPEALERYAQAHEVARAMNDGRGAAEAAIGAGNVLEEQGQWSAAEGWYHTALRQLEDATPAPERWQAFINLHIAARSRGALDESLPWLLRAEEAAADVSLEAATPFIENARGQLLTAQGQFEEAQGHFRTALAATTQARARVTIRLNLAESLLAQARTLDASEHAREAEREAIRARLVPKLPEVYRLLGRIAAAEGNPDAFVLFERALELARGRGLPALEEALTLRAYAEAEAARGEHDTARDLHAQADARFDSLSMNHERQPWADVFGPPSDSTSLPRDNERNED